MNAPTLNETSVEQLHKDLLAAWNQGDAKRFASFFDEDGNVVGFDGSQVDGRPRTIWRWPILKPQPFLGPHRRRARCRDQGWLRALLTGRCTSRTDRVHRSSSPRSSYRKPEDEALLPLLRRLVDEPRPTAIAASRPSPNRELARAGEPTLNHKRVFRIMRRERPCCSPPHRPQERPRPRRQGGRQAPLQPALVLGRL